MYITITGKLGSGKSTVCNLLVERCGYQVYSTGKIQRGIAERMGISTLELNQLMMSNPQYDNLIDNETVRISKESIGQDLLFDSRLAFHFVEESFKIFAYVSPMEAAKRVFGDSKRGAVESYRDVMDARDQLLKRSEVENERFKEMYHLDNLDYNNYNLVIDTTWVTPERIADEILRALEAYKADKDVRMLSFSPKCLYPTMDFDSLDAALIEEWTGRMKNGEMPSLDAVGIVRRGPLHYCVKGMEYVVAALRAGKDFISGQTVTEDNGSNASDLTPYQEAGNFEYKD